MHVLALRTFLSEAELAGLLRVLVHLAVIAALALLLQLLLVRTIRSVRLRVMARIANAEQARRAETLGRVLRNASAVLIGTVAVILGLNEIGVSLAPFLGAAGIVGLAIGFGAQSLVKDYFSGVLLLLEGQIITGDIVEAAGKQGVVEDMTLRYVQLRDGDGHVHYVPNGQITAVTNFTRQHAYAVVEVGVGYGADLGAVAEVMRRTAAALAADPAFVPSLLAPFEYIGVERWADSAVMVRGRFKVQPLEQWTVRREYLRRLKEAFDAAGIEIPYPHVVNLSASASPPRPAGSGPAS